MTQISFPRQTPGSMVSSLFNWSFSRGIDVLSAFGPGRREMNLPEIASAVGITKSAAQRYAYTLETLGFLKKDPNSKRYSLTPRTLELGYRYLLVNSFIERANPHLFNLNRKCRETVNFSEPDRADMVYVARFSTQLKTGVHMPLGRRLPMFCTSSGRAYLSGLPTDKAIEILESSPRPRYTSTTVSNLGELLDMLAQARELGYSYANGEYFRGDLGVAVPMFDEQNHPIGAVNISAPSSRWSMTRLKKELVPILIETCQIISRSPPTSLNADAFLKGYRDGHVS